jgi:nitroimidazol reductase NimA-like FMN-containing flavoprotein (pyridoxamine 5'-phosphate oxidase superfamily)
VSPGSLAFEEPGVPAKEMQAYDVTERNRIRQLREQARYDTATVHAILDAGLVAHVGFVQDERPQVIPMLYGRAGESLYLHGASKARITRLLAGGAPVCVEVTLLDGIVAARSAFNSSMNYRSVVAFGRARLLEDEVLRLEALRVISEHVMPGRWDELRAPSAQELKATGVVELGIESASAKVAEGPPEDEESDYASRTWAGVVPIVTCLAAPVDDPRLPAGVEVSPAIARLADRRF